jgi:hypothetical protein
LLAVSSRDRIALRQQVTGQVVMGQVVDNEPDKGGT